MISSHVGAKEYITSHNLGWVVDGDLHQWNATLQTIWKTKNEWPKMREHAKSCIQRDFSGDEQLQGYLEVYNHLK